MAHANKASAKVRQAKGKANEIVGAARGNLKQEAKGRMQKATGKAEERLGQSRR